MGIFLKMYHFWAFKFCRVQQRVGDSNYIYAKESRKRCVEELRQIIEQTREYGWQLPSDLPLIEEFITDELRILASIDKPIQDDHLEIKALKALWQFMYLQRSEVLRNFAIYQYDECSRLKDEKSWLVLSI